MLVNLKVWNALKQRERNLILRDDGYTWRPDYGDGSVQISNRLFRPRYPHNMTPPNWNGKMPT